MQTKLVKFLHYNNIFIAISIATFITLASIGLQNVGYYYDELLHAVAAQETLIGKSYLSQVHRVIKIDISDHKIPLMILYYVGPLKSYALLIPFQLNSSSMDTLRTFTIICGAITIVATYILAKRYFSDKTALIVTILLISDPTFILSSRYDWGPTALQNVLKVLITIGLLQSRSIQGVKVTLFLIGAGGALMLWDKLNAIWFLIPVTILLVVYHRNSLRVLKYALVGFFIFSIPLIIIIQKRPFFYTESQKSFAQFETYYYQTKSNPNLAGLLDHYQSSPKVKIHNILETLNGVSIPRHILSSPPTNHTMFAYVFFFISLLTLLKSYRQFLYVKKVISILDPKIALWTIATTIALLILTTAHANAPHHSLMLYPFLHILLADMLGRLFQSNKIVVPLIISLLVISNLIVLAEFNQKSSNNMLKIYWQNNSLNQVVSNLRQSNGKYLALDWGITLPIGFLSKGTVEIRDLQAFYEPKCDELRLLINQGYSAITYTYDNQVFPTYYTQCQSELSQLPIEEISNYRIYKNPLSR